MDSEQFSGILAGSVLGVVLGQIAQSHHLKAYWDDNPEDRHTMVSSWIVLAACLIVVFAIVRPRE